MNTIKNIEIIHVAPGEVDKENEQPTTTGFYAVRDADDGDRELGLFNYHVPGLSSPFASGAYPTQAVAEKNANDFATLMRVNLPAREPAEAQANQHASVPDDDDLEVIRSCAGILGNFGSYFCGSSHRSGLRSDEIEHYQEMYKRADEGVQCLMDLHDKLRGLEPAMLAAALEAPAPAFEHGHETGYEAGVLHTKQALICPRPANNRPDDMPAAECVAAGECGCVYAGAKS